MIATEAAGSSNSGVKSVGTEASKELLVEAMNAIIKIVNGVSNNFVGSLKPAFATFAAIVQEKIDEINKTADVQEESQESEKFFETLLSYNSKLVGTDSLSKALDGNIQKVRLSLNSYLALLKNYSTNVDAQLKAALIQLCADLQAYISAVCSSLDAAIGSISVLDSDVLESILSTAVTLMSAASVVHTNISLELSNLSPSINAFVQTLTNNINATASDFVGLIALISESTSDSIKTDFSDIATALSKILSNLSNVLGQSTSAQ